MLSNLTGLLLLGFTMQSHPLPENISTNAGPETQNLDPSPPSTTPQVEEQEPHPRDLVDLFGLRRLRPILPIISVIWRTIRFCFRILAVKVVGIFAKFAKMREPTVDENAKVEVEEPNKVDDIFVNVEETTVDLDDNFVKIEKTTVDDNFVKTEATTVDDNFVKVEETTTRDDNAKKVEETTAGINDNNSAAIDVVDVVDLDGTGAQELDDGDGIVDSSCKADADAESESGVRDDVIEIKCEDVADDLIVACAGNLNSFVDDEHYEFTLDAGRLVQKLCESSSSSNPSDSPSTSDSENESTVTTVPKGAARSAVPPGTFLPNTRPYPHPSISGRINRAQIRDSGTRQNVEHGAEVTIVGRIGGIETLGGQELYVAEVGHGVIVHQPGSSSSDTNELELDRIISLYPIFANFARNEAMRFAIKYGAPGIPDPNSIEWKTFVCMLIAQQHDKLKEPVPRPLSTTTAVTTSFQHQFSDRTITTSFQQQQFSGGRTITTSFQQQFMGRTITTMANFGHTITTMSNFSRHYYGNPRQPLRPLTAPSRIVDVTPTPNRSDMRMSNTNTNTPLRPFVPRNLNVDRRMPNDVTVPFWRAPPGLRPPPGMIVPPNLLMEILQEGDSYDKLLDNMLLKQAAITVRPKNIAKLKSLVGKKIVGPPSWEHLKDFF